MKKEKEASIHLYYIKYTESDLFADKTFSRAQKRSPIRRKIKDIHRED